MNAAQRRQTIGEILHRSHAPISATTLAQKLGVSRQVIVGDIALLRAAGTEICATPRGYVILPAAGGYVHRIACRHDADGMAEELHAVVELGGTVVDVIVEHPIYGQLTGSLQLSTHAEVEEFIRRCADPQVHPLSLLTQGIHLHTISCPDEGVFRSIQKKLAELQVLLAD